MRSENPASTELPNSLFVMLSVFLTVLLALFLAFSDELQTQLPSPIRPTDVVSLATQATPNPSATNQPTATITPAPTIGPENSPTATSPSIIAQASCNNAPADWLAVVVGPNETLFDLSLRYGATVGELTQANCLESGRVFPGMTLYVPPVPPTRPPCGPPQSWTTYLVRPGETLGLLARRHGTTVYAIMQANCLSDTRIFAGRRLFLPYIPPTPPPQPTIIFPTKTPVPLPTTTQTGQPSPSPSATTNGTAVPTSTETAPSGTIVPTNTPTITGTSPAGTPPATNTPIPTTSPTPEVSPTPGPSPTAVPTTPPTNTPIPTQPPTNTPPPTQPPTNTPQPSNTPIPEPTNIPVGAQPPLA